MAGILKANENNVRGMNVQPIAFNWQDVSASAEKYLEQVKRQAADILRDAQKEVDSMRSKVVAEGMLEVEQEVQNRAKKQADEMTRAAVQQQIATLTDSITQLQQQTQAWMEAWQESTVSLAVAMAEKLVRREMHADINIVAQWLSEAVQMARSQNQITIRIHPDEYSALGDQMTRLCDPLKHASQVEIIPDPDMPRGGCIVRTEHGEINQQLTVQLQRLVEEIS